MLLNSALFQLNNHAGFVLKPAFLRGFPKFDLNQPKTWPAPVQLKMTILSARQIQRGSERRVDPKVKVTYHGPKGECNVYKTRVVADNGLNPQWNESFQFEMNLAQISFLQFTIIDQDFGADDLSEFPKTIKYYFKILKYLLGIIQLSLQSLAPSFPPAT